MEIQIENLKTKMRGKKLNHYQEGLALDEFEKLIAHTEALEQQLRQYNVVGRSEQLKALLEKLLNENMCSVAGDELIEEALKGF